MEMYVRESFVLKMQLEQQRRNLLEEKKLSKSLLSNVIPKSKVQQLLNDFAPQKTLFYENKYENISVLFSDIVSFTVISSSLLPRQVVFMLNEQFLAYDRIVKRYGLEKIKTVGDAYFAVSFNHEDNAMRIVHAAMDMLADLHSINSKNHTRIQIRIGCCTGTATLIVFGSIAHK